MNLGERVGFGLVEMGVFIVSVVERRGLGKKEINLEFWGKLMFKG